MKAPYYGLLLACTLLLSGCRVDLYSGLQEAEANQMLALLMSKQIDAEKTSNKSGTLTLLVDQSDFATAVEVLRQNGYPRRIYRSVDELFPAGQLVSSPLQEQARIQYLKEQSLERMLSDIEGVVGVRVVLSNVVESSTNNGTATSPASSASVLVKYSPQVNVKSFTGQLKSLVHNALPGVRQENISVVLQAVDYRLVDTKTQTQQPGAGPWLRQGGLILALWLLLGGGVIAHGRWWRNRKVNNGTS
ncbi:type III secretion system inner membrane ring lipoprotein SctJ [Serratia quinivorans]|uniref:type III secretion system inner membrane ring lipoprotein SctJ n=1 Tax=Serratia quinivorans TaxID=137545 RepID=UPI002177A1F7|nr:type III secretion inner membrane ring lipoprotein SctJ [Serratia quinivorans]CAI1009702.1 Lipoprotein prgK precursor [Serratia quinivorans]CAI1810128.1 Lipoprotein prgK precursor [Serratia quinivorans]